MPNKINTSQPQCWIVYDHLCSVGHITALEAIGLYRIFRLAARICELRDMGYSVVTTMVRDATGKPYARYSL